MTSATLEKDLYVETSDKIGTASQLTSLLSDNGKYNLKAIWGSSWGGKGHFYFVPEDWSKAKEMLSSSEYSNYREEDVVVAYLDNKPDSISTATSKFKTAGININWFYTTTFNGKSAVVFSTSDNKKACDLFNQ